MPPVKANTVSIELPAVLTKYVTGVPDLHREGYEYSPYRETVNFRYDVNNGFYQTRIGNDSDLIHFFQSSGPELETALLACLEGADTDMKMEVLKAGSTLSGAEDERFTLAALNLAKDSNSDVRQTVRYVYEDNQRGILNLDAPTAPDPRLVNKVVEILNHGNADSQALVLPMLAALPRGLALGAGSGRGDWFAQSAGAGPRRGELRQGSERGVFLQEPDGRPIPARSGFGGTQRSRSGSRAGGGARFVWNIS